MFIDPDKLNQMSVCAGHLTLCQTRDLFFDSNVCFWESQQESLEEISQNMEGKAE